MSATEEHYSLRWNNHQSHLLRAFEALLQAETLVDVTLVCSERRVRAHKVLLGACSPLFRRIFSENPCKHPVIVLKDFQGWEVQAVVDFMYKGEVSVAQEQLRTVIRAGESLQVRGLVDQDRLMSDDCDLESLSVTPLPESARTPSVHPASPEPAAHEPPSKIPSWGPEPEPCASPIPRRKQARPRRRSGDGPHDLSRTAATPPQIDTAENLSLKRSPKNQLGSVSLKDIRLISAGRAPSSGSGRARSSPGLKLEGDDRHSPDQAEMPLPPRLFPSHQDMPFPPPVSALTLTPPHMFGLDSPLGLFPPGMDHGKLYNPLMELSDPRHPLDSPMFTNVKKKWRPKGQHSAPRGGPPRSWTNAELTEALQHVWNKKMTTSQASRIFGIPYNSLLMYVRGKYGKSLKLEQLRKDCIGGPLDMLNMGSGNNNNNQPPGKHHDKEDQHISQSNQRPASSEPDILSNPMFNPFSQSFYPEFPPGFPMPLNMLHLLPPNEKMRDIYSQSMPLALDSMSAGKEEDCKSDRSKENSADEDNSDIFRSSALTRDERREIMQQNGQD